MNKQKIMEKLKVFFKNIWETKIGKLLASFVLACGSFGLANIWDFMYWIGCLFMIYPLGLFCVLMAYAWVINPMREWKENKKSKEENSKEMTAGEIAEAIETKSEIIPEATALPTSVPEPAKMPTSKNKKPVKKVVKKAVKKNTKKTINKITLKKKTTTKNGKRRK